MPYETLIETDALAIRFEDSSVRVVDCRAVLGDVDAGRQAYEAGHIPGAVHADLERDLSGPIQPGITGRHPLPHPDRLAETLGRWGVDDGTQLIAYDAGSGAFAARLWWLARWLGHSAVAVLNGGFEAWSRAGYPTSREPARALPRRFVRRAPLTRLVDASAVLERKAGALLDARAEARYRGITEPIDKVAGHIPGALCAPFEGNLGTDGRFRPAAELEARFASLGVGKALVTCYCGSGVTACHNVLALRIAGFPEPALYPGSWSEWITDPARPIA
jgi:thiosulfate/3-mercaptopyruvate sulfurtransferase